jgi:hypothetical protein
MQIGVYRLENSRPEATREAFSGEENYEDENIQKFGLTRKDPRIDIQCKSDIGGDSHTDVGETSNLYMPDMS